MATPKTSLLTGASGFVGANLARRLLRDGHKVHLLVRKGHATWRLNDISAHCAIHEIDLLDFEQLSNVIAKIKPDWIFHLAANGAYSWQNDFDQIVATNFTATVNLVRACLATEFGAFVNTGSSSEYGLKDHPPGEEEGLEPNSHYAAAKASATIFCKHLAAANKVHIPTLRLYSVYGSWEEPNRLMPAMIVHGLNKQLPPLVDKDIARDYIYIDDVLDAYIAAAETETDEPGAVYNVGTGVQTSIGEVVEIARSLLDIDEQPQWGSMPNRKWDTTVWVSNNRKLQERLGWRPEHNFKQGFAEFVDWFKSDKKIRQYYESKLESFAGSRL
ncbi:MAG TPA: SDR family NAD(P)-dependent oxidoreductase [Chroococcales cyanobacterium]